MTAYVFLDMNGSVIKARVSNVNQEPTNLLLEAYSALNAEEENILKYMLVYLRKNVNCVL